MDLSEALKTSIDTLVAADSGSGGLANTSATAYVQKVVDSDDPNYASGRAINGTTIEVDVYENASTIFGTGESTTREKDFVLLRLTVVTWRDPGMARMDAVVYRLRTKFDGVTPASQTGWAFGPMSVERVRPIVADGAMTRKTVEFSLRAGAGTVVEGTGRQVSVTFAGAEGAAIAGTYFPVSADRTFSPEMWDVTRFGDVHERLSLALGRTTVVVACSAASVTPVPPTGTSASLVFNDNAAGGKKTTANAILTGHRFYATSREESQPNTVYLTFRVSAEQEGINPVVAA